jgi:hypothetical protein
VRHLAADAGLRTKEEHAKTVPEAAGPTLPAVGKRIAKPNRVVTFSLVGVRHEERYGIADRRRLRGTAALDVQVLLETVTPALTEEPDTAPTRQRSDRSTLLVVG